MVNEILNHADGQIIEWRWSSNSPLMQRPFWTAVYLVDQTLFDCGAPGSTEEFDNFLMNLPVKKRPLRCILTHAHEDHAGTGILLTTKYHIPVYAPLESIPRLKEGWTYEGYHAMAWGEGGLTGFIAQPYPDSITTPHGYHFERLFIPGHAPDLHAFIERKHQWAFLGDLMQPQYQMLFAKTFPQHEDIEQITNSLEKLYTFTEGLDDLVMFVSGKGVFQGRSLIRTRIAEIHELHKKVHELDKELGVELKDARKMRKMLHILFGGESMIGGMTGGELSRENMVLSLLKWKR